MNELTLFMCGPNKCEHDYSEFREFRDKDTWGATLVCSKCGAWAIDEAIWGQEEQQS